MGSNRSKDVCEDVFVAVITIATGLVSEYVWRALRAKKQAEITKDDYEISTEGL